MFRKLVQATIATALVATPMIAVSAEAQRRDAVTTVKHRPNGTVVQKTTYRSWSPGQRFDRRYAASYRVVDYRPYRAARLYAPPRGHYWARSGRDAVLVSPHGRVVKVIRGVRW